MRSVAVGRYRFLTTNRSAGWALVVAIAGCLFAAFIVGVSSGVMNSASYSAIVDTLIQRGDPALTISIGGRLLAYCYVFQFGILAAACHAFGSRNRRADAAGAADLMETAPVTPSERFWGDAMGVFASTMMVHFASLPLLALVFALSPFPSSWMIGLELAVIAVVALESAASSWKLHTSRDTSPTARTAGATAALIILMITALRLLTSWSEFRDAVAVFLVWPSPRAWFGITAAIFSPLLLVLVLLMIFAGFTFFYYVRAVRAVEHG